MDPWRTPEGIGSRHLSKVDGKTVSFTAINAGTDGTSGQVSFSIANTDTLFNTINPAFNDVGGPNSGSFDWGLPFFLGRNIFTVVESQNTPAGAEPYWAY